jgi:hypothetical protein
MKNLKSVFKQLVLVSMMIFLAFQVACNKQAPVTPNESVGIPEDQVTILRLADNQSFLRPFSNQQWIGPSGGSLWVGDSASGYSGLVFPDSALSSNTLIQFDWESEGLLQGDFYPAGASFNQPVYIKLSYIEADLTGINENELAIYHYNPQTSQWEEIAGSTVHTSEQYVDGYIYHFSRYAIGDEQ